MRLMAQVKGGYYPAAPVAVALVGNLIKYRGGAVLDPCCGEGEAIDTLAQSLGAPREQVYAIELEQDRAATTKARLAGAHVMDPCSCFDARINAGSMAVAWVNPPFDDNVHGGRAEVDFLIKATSWLMPGGVLCFVIPEHVVGGCYKPAVAHLLEAYDQLALLRFPEEHRPYDEVVVIGVKRRGKVPVDIGAWFDVTRRDLADVAGTLSWEAPETQVCPKLFEKGGLTEAELIAAIAASPLWKLTQLPPDRPVPRPPLPLAKGHIALLLASGQLDGVVCPPGEEPHVVRGSANKVQAPPHVEQEVLESGGVKTITTIRERIQLTVRAVSLDGVIRTFE